jgi:hypothetical protein
MTALPPYDYPSQENFDLNHQYSSGMMARPSGR